MAASAALAVRLGQDRGFDLLNYHYYSGFAFLHKAFGYDLAPAQIQSFHNPILHVLSYLALSIFPGKGAAALLGAIQGINFYLVFRISQALFSRIKNPFRFLLSLINAGVGFYGITSCTELGTTYGDNLVSILVLSGLLLLIRRLPAERISSHNTPFVFGIAGILIGAACGLKLTAAVYVLAVALSASIVLFRVPSYRKLVTHLFSGLIVGFLATYAYWGINLYAAYQNPFAPYLNKIFHSPFLAPDNFRDIRFLPADWQQAFFYPFYFIRKNHLVSEIDFRDLRLAFCYCAIVLLAGFQLSGLAAGSRKKPAIASGQQKGSELLFLALFFFITYIGWQSQSSIYRYLAVLELLAPAFLTLAISRLFTSRHIVFWASMVLNLAIVLAAVPIDFGRQPFETDLLRLRIPQIQGLDKSLILMSAYEPTAYIVPSFPKDTRFARISSTFTTPGENAFLGEKIRKLLALYDAEHTFAYIPNADEMGQARLDASFYGRMIDSRSCFEIRSGVRNRGYLCGIAGSRVKAAEKPVPEVGSSPKFVNTGILNLDARASRDFIDCRIPGIKSNSVDILYKLEGEIMPPIRNWTLSDDSLLHLGPMSRNGTYTLIGIREYGSPEPDLWMQVNAEIRIQTKR
jgi:hypothetical protein